MCTLDKSLLIGNAVFSNQYEYELFEQENKMVIFQNNSDALYLSLNHLKEFTVQTKELL